jgi:peptide subunit release factor 1 (eRF1)
MDETIVSFLRDTRSPTTTLVSYYVRPGVNLTTAFLKEEMSQSNNIKSSQTRNGVQQSLRFLQRELKNHGATIEGNGLCLFASPEQCV